MPKTWSGVDSRVTNRRVCLACVFVLNDALLSTSPVRIEEAATALLGLVPPNNLANFALLSGPMPLDVLRSNVDRIQMGSRDWLYEPLAASGVPIPLKIASVPEEPEAEAAFRKKLLDDLMSDDRLRGNDSEPSLVAVGRLIEEEGIMHAQDILTTYKSVLGLDVEEKYRNTLPWYSHHPYRQLMNGYGPFEERSGAVAEVGRKMMFEQLLPSGQEIHDLFVAYSRGPEAAQGIRLIRATPTRSSGISYGASHILSRTTTRREMPQRSSESVPMPWRRRDASSPSIPGEWSIASPSGNVASRATSRS